MNSLQKVVSVIVSPTKAFEGIREKPTVLLPIILIILLPLAYTVVYWSKLEPSIIVILENQSIAMGIEPTKEYLDLQIAITKYSSYATGVGILIGTLISALYYFICSKIAGTEAKYKEIFSLVLHVGMISMLSYVLNFILSAMNIDVTTSITSVASFLPISMSASILYGVLSTVELFNVWSLIIMVIGLQVVVKMSKKAAIISVSIAYGFTILMITVSTMLANITGALG